PGTSPDLQAAHDLADLAYLLRTHVRFYSTEIEVIQGPTGEVYRVSIASTSGSHAFDESALQALDRALNARPFPADLVRPDGPTRSVYLLEAGETTALQSIAGVGVVGPGVGGWIDGLGAQLCLPNRPCIRRRVALVEVGPALV